LRLLATTIKIKTVKKVGKSCQNSCQKSCPKLVKKLSKGCQKSYQKVGKKLSKSCQKVATNFVSPGKKPKKVNYLENKNGNKKKKIIGIP
jgi:protein-arginine kinase activator protein McsA